MSARATARHTLRRHRFKMRPTETRSRVSVPAASPTRRRRVVRCLSRSLSRALCLSLASPGVRESVQNEPSSPRACHRTRFFSERTLLLLEARLSDPTRRARQTERRRRIREEPFENVGAETLLDVTSLGGARLGVVGRRECHVSPSARRDYAVREELRSLTRRRLRDDDDDEARGRTFSDS